MGLYTCRYDRQGSAGPAISVHLRLSVRHSQMRTGFNNLDSFDPDRLVPLHRGFDWLSVVHRRTGRCLVATACSSPPEGRARWTLDLLAGAMVKLTEHDSISRETVRRRLAENDLKPWRKDMW